MEYVVFAVWCFAVALAGGLVGLVLGNIRLPATLLVSSSPAAGAGANIAISGVAAAAASIAHIRAGRVNWRLFGWMAPPSMVGAVAGGYVSGRLPGDLLLAVIAATLFYFGVDLLRPKATVPARRPDAARPDEAPRLNIRAAVWSGLVIGFIGGVVGLILGSLRVPALLKLVHETPQKAVGTNITVGVLVGLAGLVGHLPSEGPDVTALAVGAAASIPGALLGSRLTGRLSEAQLLGAIGIILIVASVAIVVQIAI